MSELIDGKPQLPPGMCFICEASNPCQYVDTFRDFEGVVREKLDGRKYICEECIEDGAKKLGYATPKDHAHVQNELAKAVVVIEALKKDLAAFSDLQAVIDHFGGSKETVVTVKPKATKPKAA
ncbi:MAG: hypothetical protein KGL39_49940 [Patescibacteria group bacterium]|nr:hypothetical protein [Patescibacteria group bacterium]